MVCAVTTVAVAHFVSFHTRPPRRLRNAASSAAWRRYSRSASVMSSAGGGCLFGATLPQYGLFGRGPPVSLSHTVRMARPTARMASMTVLMLALLCLAELSTPAGDGVK